MTHGQMPPGVDRHEAQALDGQETPQQTFAHSQHGVGIDPRIHRAPTFHRPQPDASHEMSPSLSHQHGPSSYTAQPTPIQPGGAGPLTGLRDGLTTPMTAPEASPTQPSYQVDQSASMSGAPSNLAELTAQAFQGQSPRPSFPAAPSKVLAEQYAKGGDGHIRQGDQVPAFEAQSGALLEGVYPVPEATVQTTAGRAAKPTGEAGISPRPSPRLQHIDPNLQTKLAGVGEPNLAEMPAEQARAATASRGAFWAFEAGHISTQPTQRQIPRALLSGAVFILIGLLGFAAWSQYQARTQVITPVFVAAPIGPERIVPENPGGIQIPDQGIGVLNPEIAAEELNLDPLLTAQPAAVTPVTGIPTGLDEAVIIEEQLPAQGVESQATEQAGAIATDPAQANAQNTSSLTLPVNIPAPRPAGLFASVAAQPIEVAQVANSLVVTSAPAGIFVQEGSYLSLETAQSAYASLQRQAGARLSGISPLYHQIDINGQTRYRLYLTGFTSIANAELLGGALGRNQDSWFIRGGR